MRLSTKCLESIKNLYNARLHLKPVSEYTSQFLSDFSRMKNILSTFDLKVNIFLDAALCNLVEIDGRFGFSGLGNPPDGRGNMNF